MHGNRKPPASEVTPSVTPRRDDRAEPDDDEDPSRGRVDVVSFERDPASSGLGALRRELARLHQQASAVERTIEDQKRAGKDDHDKLERANDRIVQLETKLAAAEAETSSLKNLFEAALADLHTMRTARDDLARVVETAKDATVDMSRFKEEAIEQRERAEGLAAQVTKLEGELGDLRKRQFQEALKVTDRDTEIADAKVSLAAAQVEVNAARADVTSAREDAARAREDAAKARAETARAREEITKAKDDNARDRATARDRIDMLERALDDARAVTARWEHDYETVRAERDAEAKRASDEAAASIEREARLRREIDDAFAQASLAEERANAEIAARRALEDAVLRVRDEVAAAFGRIDSAAVSPFTTKSPSVLPTASTSGRAPSNAPKVKDASAPPGSLDTDWVSPDSKEHGTSIGLGVAPSRDSVAPESISPVSRSVPPPKGSSPVIQTSPTMPPLTYASVPPQVHDAMATARKPTAPPPPPADLVAMVEGREGRVDGAATPSVPPVSMAADDGPTLSEDTGTSTREERASQRTATRGSVFPPAEGGAVREELFSRLVDPAHVNEAAVELKQHGDWLQGRPPPTFVAALANIDYDAEGAVFELARAWEREPLSLALVAALRSEPDARQREHTAWLLKHLASGAQVKAIGEVAKSDDDSTQTRRWLLEALDRLAAGRSIEWKDVGDVVAALARHPDSTLRDGVVGLLVSLDRSDEKRRALLDILRDDDDEVVLASAVNALANVLPVELDPAVVERLLGHPSARVQKSVRELVERARQR